MTVRTLHVVIYREGDGFVARCLNVDVVSEGDTEQEARENIREALGLYFDAPIPDVEFAAVGEAHVEELTLKSD